MDTRELKQELKDIFCLHPESEFDSVSEILKAAKRTHGRNCIRDASPHLVDVLAYHIDRSSEEV